MQCATDKWISRGSADQCRCLNIIERVQKNTGEHKEKHNKL